MNTSSAGMIILGVVLGILLIATTIGKVLDYRSKEGEPSPTIQNLNARIMAWWVMVGAVSLAFVSGKYGILILFGLISFAALREFLSLLETRRGDHIALWASFFVILPAQYYLIGIEWYGLYSIFIPVYAFLALPIISAIRGDSTSFMSRISEVQWALMTCVFCLSHVPALVTLPIPGYENQQAFLVIFLLMVVQGSDVLQYVWGKLLGRRKVAPSLSPSKTVEGLVGGVGSATALGAALWWMTPFTPLQAAGMALVISVLGFLGGLVMS